MKFYQILAINTYTNIEKKNTENQEAQNGLYPLIP